MPDQLKKAKPDSNLMGRKSGCVFPQSNMSRDINERMVYHNGKS